MVLAVSAEITLSDTVLTIVATHTAAAGEFLRGWHAHGEAEGKVEVQIDGTIKSLGTIKTGPNGAGDWNDAGHIITPIALFAGEVVTLKVKRKESVAPRDFRGELF